MTKPPAHYSRSFWHTPLTESPYRRIFHSVLRGGRARLEPMYHLESWVHPGHDLILSFAGTGVVRIGQQTFALRAGELAWINYNRPHWQVRWPSRSGPWEYLFIRVDSEQLDLIAEVLKVETNPIFALPKPRAAVNILRRMFTLMRDRPLSLDAALHASVTALIALLFEARQAAAASLNRPELPESAGAAHFEQLLNTMRSELHRQWKVSDLARLRRMSVPHFYRRFAEATGTTPMGWLRRERITRAKQRLVETNDRIGEIAANVGYADPLYFSRHFRKLVGMGPRAYRKSERVRSAGRATADP